MTWVKLDDLFPDHPKVQAAGQAAAWLHVAGICYCSRYLTDGLIPNVALAGLGQYTKSRARKLADVLVRVGLWEQEDGAYRIHDYLDFQPSREQVERQRGSPSSAASAGTRLRWRSRRAPRRGGSTSRPRGDGPCGRRIEGRQAQPRGASGSRRVRRQGEGPG